MSGESDADCILMIDRQDNALIGHIGLSNPSEYAKSMNLKLCLLNQ